MNIRGFIAGFAQRSLRGSAGNRARIQLANSSREDASRKHILIVDDDPIIRETTSRALEKRGHTVRVAADCSEAITAVGESKSDVILLDLQFPPDVANGGGIAWDGFGLMSWLRGLKNVEGTRFIIITGDDSPQCRQRAVKAGASGFFSKPIDHERLLSELDAGKSPRVTAI